MFMARLYSTESEPVDYDLGEDEPKAVKQFRQMAKNWKEGELAPEIVGMNFGWMGTWFTVGMSVWTEELGGEDLQYEGIMTFEDWASTDRELIKELSEQSEGNGDERPDAPTTVEESKEAVSVEADF